MKVSIVIAQDLRPAAILTTGEQLQPAQFLESLHTFALGLPKTERRRKDILVMLTRARTAEAAGDLAALVPAVWDAARIWAEISDDDSWRKGGNTGAKYEKQRSRTVKSESARDDRTTKALAAHRDARSRGMSEEDARAEARATGIDAATLRQALRRQARRRSIL